MGEADRLWLRLPPASGEGDLDRETLMAREPAGETERLRAGLRLRPRGEREPAGLRLRRRSRSSVKARGRRFAH